MFNFLEERLTEVIKNEVEVLIKDGNAYKNGKVIPLASEEDVFKLLGLEYVHPAERTAAGYWKEFKKEGHKWGIGE